MMSRTRRPAAAADVRVSATLGHFYSDRATVTLSLVNGPRQVDVSATVSCDLRGGDARVVRGENYRARDWEASPATLERLLGLVRNRLPAAVREAAQRACEAAQRKADERRLELDEEGAVKLERRIAEVRAAAGL